MRATFALVLCLMLPLHAGAWGEKGHLLINRLAIQASGTQLPPFMTAAAGQLAYNGEEPDRWREETDTPMNIAQAPDHFFDSEYWGAISTIPKDRYTFMAALTSRKVDLAKVGYLPYTIMENYGRLRNALRQWRRAATSQDREYARANAVFYAGLLGHYVGDGSQPLHLSIHFNGWDDKTANPKNFTKDRTLHGRYENAYVNTATEASLVKTRVKPPHRLPDVFAAVKTYLSQSFAELEPLYEMQKMGEFNPETPRPKGTAFIDAELARAATMLGDLWYTAWLESGQPLP